MPDVTAYFDTKKVNEDIANLKDLEIEVIFEDESGQGVIKSGELEFVGSLADKINNWNTQGMYGGPGIFEAPPLRLESCNQVIFDGGINTAACETTYECDKVVAALRTNKIDFINDRASGFTFPYLASLPSTQPGKISQSDYVLVPYVINSIPDYVNVMVAGIGLYSMVKELKEVIEKTQSVIEEITGDTAMTVGSVVNPIIATAMAIGRILVDILRLVFYLLYLFFIIQFIVSLINMIFDNLIQPVKYKKGMRVLTLFQKATAYMGMAFSSTLLNSARHRDDVIIPRKTAFDTKAPLNANASISQALFGNQSILTKDFDDAHNPKSTGYPEDWTFANLILAEEDRLNAEIRVIGNTLYFETKDFFSKFANYTLPDIQRKNADPHKTNACELDANYKISYQLDDQETNTYDQYTGTSCQMQLSANTVHNPKNVLLRGIKEVNLQYALVKRKEKLNGVEQVVSFLYNVADAIYTAITGFFNTVPKRINKILKAIAQISGGKPPQIPLIPPFPPNPIKARIGMMLLSSDFIGVPKILVIDSSNKVHTNNSYWTSARGLMDELHFTNFAIRKIDTYSNIKNDHNQWIIYEDKEIPFCCDDYLKLLDNNFCKTHDQKPAKIKSIVWMPYKSTARISYRVKEQYTKNLNQTYIIDGK